MIVPSASRAAISGGRARAPTTACSSPSRSTILPRSVLREAVGRLGDLLQQEVREVAAVDVAGRDLGRDDVGRRHRLRRAVVAEPVDAVERAGRAAASSADDLTAVLAVEADVARRLLDDAVGLAGDEVAVVGQADVDALAAAVEGEKRRPGSSAAAAPMATEPSNEATVRRKASNSAAAGRRGRATIAGITLASVVIGPATRRPCSTRRSAWLSTSPLRTPTTNGGSAPPGCSISSLFTGWALGSRDDADAGPAGVAEHGDLGPRAAQGEAQEGVVGDAGAQRPGVVAELADLGRRLVHEGQAAARRSGRAPIWNSGSPARSATEAGDRRVVHVEAVVPDEDVQPGRVAAAHLHAVDRRQRLLDREVAGQRAGPASRPARSTTAPAVRRRSRRIAHSGSRSAISSALRRSSTSASKSPRPTRRRSRPRRRRAGRGGRRSPGRARGGRRGRAGRGGRGAERRRPRRPPRRRRRRRAASAASRPASSSAAVGTGRVGGRLTMPTIPHMRPKATERCRRAHRRPARATKLLSSNCSSKRSDPSVRSALVVGAGVDGGAVEVLGAVGSVDGDTRCRSR